MTDEKRPDREAVGTGCGGFLAIYALAWLVVMAGSLTVGMVIAGAGALTALGLAVAGRNPRERGIGVGMLIGVGIALLTFAACFALVVSSFDS